MKSYPKPGLGQNLLMYQGPVVEELKCPMGVSGNYHTNDREPQKNSEPRIPWNKVSFLGDLH